MNFTDSWNKEVTVTASKEIYVKWGKKWQAWVPRCTYMHKNRHTGRETVKFCQREIQVNLFSIQSSCHTCKDSSSCIIPHTPFSCWPKAPIFFLRYFSKRVQYFLSNCPAGGKNTFTKAQRTCQAQQRIQIHLPRKLKFSTPQNRPTFLVTLTGYGTRGREKASGSCTDTDQRYFMWLTGVSLFSHKCHANLLICRGLYNNSC